MKFSLANEHLRFYQQHGYVEFEGVLNSAKLQQILHAIRKEKFDSTTQHYEKHHDLWRYYPEVKRNLFHKEVSSIMASLSGVIPLRIGYDQLIPKGFTRDTPRTLKEMSSIQGVIGGYLLCLQDSPGETVVQPEDEEVKEVKEGEERKKPAIAPFSTRAGNLVFIAPDAPIDLSRNPCDHLLVCFAGPKPIYCFNPGDPHTHGFKKKGYVFGDKIQENDLPTVLREFTL